MQWDKALQLFVYFRAVVDAAKRCRVQPLDERGRCVERVLLGRQRPTADDLSLVFSGNRPSMSAFAQYAAIRSRYSGVCR